MQPPPRKCKATTALRNIHNEQITKLQAKHQQDVDFLEDIRNFTKLRASIEKEYGQALLKLATTHLQRKVPTFPEIKSDTGNEHKTVYTVWRTLLDETEKIAKARLAAAEVYHQQISESAKVVRSNKLQVAKKCFENIRKMHEDIQQCVIEIDKTRKLYFEEEHMAHEAREKAHDAEEKLKRKKGRIFQSISSLQKNSAKFSFRKEACDIQATKARNDYILALVAANAHQSRFYNVDLAELIQIIDCDIYDKIKEYIQLTSRTELLTCAACQSSFSTIQEHSQMITRQYTAECFLQDNPVLSKPVQYAFEPCDNDPITIISTEHNAGLCLNKEAKKWGTCIAKETRTLRDSWTELNKLQTQLASSEKPPEVTGEQGSTQTDIESRIDELKQIIRRAETSKSKAEARMEALEEGGVNVEEYMQNVDTDSLGPYDGGGDSLSRSGTVSSRGSRKSLQSENYDEDNTSEANDSMYDSDFHDGASDVSAPAKVPSVSGTDSPVPSAMGQDMDIVAAVQSAWEDTTDSDISSQPLTMQENREFTTESSTAVNEEEQNVNVIRCIALFSYEATNADELSFVEQEELELVGEGDGDGWVKARNYRGEEGFIPQNYVEAIEGQQFASSIQSAPVSFSSVDYTMPEEEEGQFMEIGDATIVVETGKGGVTYCQALYDYEATSEEELSFSEGRIIQILRKVVHDVDDGWWEGEIDGKIGIFPSLVVEELKENGEMLTPQDGNTPSDSAPPPAFTPPKPQFLVPPSQVLLTQPTPETEEEPPGKSQPPKSHKHKRHWFKR